MKKFLKTWYEWEAAKTPEQREIETKELIALTFIVIIVGCIAYLI